MLLDEMPQMRIIYDKRLEAWQREVVSPQEGTVHQPQFAKSAVVTARVVRPPGFEPRVQNAISSDYRLT